MSGASRAVVCRGESTPEIQGTFSGISLGQIFSSTAHGQVSRGERRMAYDNEGAARSSAVWITHQEADSFCLPFHLRPSQALALQD